MICWYSKTMSAQFVYLISVTKTHLIAFQDLVLPKTLRMLKLMNVATISERTFYRHTSSYRNAVVYSSGKSINKIWLVNSLRKTMS